MLNSEGVRSLMLSQKPGWYFITTSPGNSGWMWWAGTCWKTHPKDTSPGFQAGGVIKIEVATHMAILMESTDDNSK